MTKRLIFSLDEERDRDILAWWDRQENKSASIRALIRQEMGQRSITLGDVYQAVREIDRKLSSGPAVAGHSGDASGVDEPSDVAAALDKLGL